MMISKHIFISLFVCMLIISIPVFSNEWGKVTPAERELTTVSEDPDADYVVLFEKGEVVITPDFMVDFYCHRRIKILSENGFDAADVEIRYWHEDKIKDLQAHTILKDGKKIKVRGKEIYKKQDQKMKSKVFAFPGVEVGAILEYRFVQQSKYIIDIEPWYFQNNAYTLRSELEVLLPKGFQYNVTIRNPNQIELNPNQIETFSAMYPKRKPTLFTWYAENIPGIKNEAYMPPLKDYLTSLRFQIVSYQDIYTNVKFLRNWTDETKKLKKTYKNHLKTSKELQKVIDKLIEKKGKKNIEMSVFAFVRSNIATSDSRVLWGKDLKLPIEVLKEGEGSRVEKNLLLIALLKQAGFEAQPFMISTRSNGQFIDFIADRRQFNHLLVHLRVNDKIFFLDAGARYYPFGSLPPDDCADQGMLLKEESYELKAITLPKLAHSKGADTKVVLHESGDLSCQTTLSYTGHFGAKLRADLAEEDENDFIDEILGDRFQEVQLDSFKIINRNLLAMPLKIVLHYQIKNYVQVAGELMYMNPSIFHRIEKNPFHKKSRHFPVFYDVTIYSKETMQITLPSNYSVDEVPLSANHDRSIRYSASYSADKNVFNYKRVFRIGKRKYSIDEYPHHRAAYDRVVEYDSNHIVFKRNAD